MVALVTLAVVRRTGRADENVVADLRELRFDVDRLRAALLYLELQDMTGLVRATSGGSRLPPQVSVRDPAPLGIVGEERHQWTGVSSVQGLGRCAELVEPAQNRGRLLGREQVAVRCKSSIRSDISIRTYIKEIAVPALEAPFRLPEAPARSDLVAKYFRGLGDPTRVRILELLRDDGELSVGELVVRLDQPQPKVSNHLACLRWCGFIQARREHRTVFNRIADDRVVKMLDLAHALLDDNAEHVAACCRIDKP